MDRSPLKSPWAKKFMQIHESLLIRRHIIKELNEYKLEDTVLRPMAKYYFLCFVSSISFFYLLRKETLAIKFICSAGTFSLSFLYLQLYYEETFYYFKGLENSITGEIIRKNYIELLPDSWVVKKFKDKEEQIKKFNDKFRYRENALEKFYEYCASRQVCEKNLKVLEMFRRSS
ncbi:hypothetical protein SteCoe_20650 [Stentor coeruleus]|uniref:Uncharacterized protein n=1 Tax=Stentor coeruleus TaxID=5963 RepID=A0A1R2BRT4_9CILI|nr:hypothetical protein SteCoe_20650 [Stentor coeruleus]